MLSMDIDVVSLTLNEDFGHGHDFERGWGGWKVVK
jgi:hypothetical protein